MTAEACDKELHYELQFARGILDERAENVNICEENSTVTISYMDALNFAKKRMDGMKRHYTMFCGEDLPDYVIEKIAQQKQILNKLLHDAISIKLSNDLSEEEKTYTLQNTFATYRYNIPSLMKDNQNNK